ncbi:arsenosugar biosynthesis radical SAM (seleno)protein ArsS [Pedobacter puniceum]|uniref:Radical SAM/Cys-rich domain protein n=1 Tax=Pedobacter puniceum TaxID=2666136 RepID=A0A7K0FLZ3_9SPHI|nr:arsenosugar biosynthesis radical SAM (seleno)protein ArsS [Pedobacter puniceum]MRX46986.1 radical SAM/Cys-rich domain protein [Pedobacter puniceum]
MGVKQISKSLKASGNALGDHFYQLKVLSQKEIEDGRFENFNNKINTAGVPVIKPSHLEIFQLNIGKLCNQTCAHCHVDAGPDRKEENMSFETLERCLYLIKTYGFKTVDITGGAPEMNPHFRWFVENCSILGVKVMVRCNLTIIMANQKYADLPQFFATNKVHVVSSLPHFSASRTDAQRGDGVFEDSIAALKKLNDVGYGKEDSGLMIDLVYNPSGAFLPGDQTTLEAEFKRQLKRKFDIVFNNLYAITNLPISRFLDYLLETGKYLDYMHQLVDAFNPATLNGLMCRNTISISWEGYMYDCDFNQMLDLKFTGKAKHINDFDVDEVLNRNIIVNNHCYGCTAGSGSSCGGEIAS